MVLNIIIILSLQKYLDEERFLYDDKAIAIDPIVSFYPNNIRMATTQGPFYFNPHITFFVFPSLTQEGEIWPNSRAEVSVTFQPEEATSYSRVVYCDVTGRESRLPLKIRGEGIGPCCVFSFDTLDIQNVFVSSAHAYETVLENKGDIDAVYALEPSESFFGPKFTFAPSSGSLHPGQLQVIQVQIS